MDQTLRATISLDDQMSKALNNIEGNLNKLSKAGTQTTNKMEKAFGGAFGNITQTVADGSKWVIAGAGAMAGAFATFGVKTASDLQGLSASFETLTGSVDKGQKLFQDLKKMGASTPFEITDLARATQTMLSFGISVEDSQKYLGMLGDVSLGNKEKLSGLSLAFAQVQSTGRLMGQDLLQMINSGFNPLTIISEKTGKSMAVLKKEMEDGAISADMVADAFKTATSEGGLFYKGMERGAVTLNGTFSTAVDNTKNFVAGLVGLSDTGEIVEGTLIDLYQKGLNKFNEAITKIDTEKLSKDLSDAIIKVTDAVKAGIDFYKQYGDAINAVGIFVGTLTGLLYANWAATQLMTHWSTVLLPSLKLGLAALVSPFGLVAIAIAAVIAIGYLLWKNWDTVKEKAGQLGNWIKQKWGEISKATSDIWTGITNKITEVWNNITSAVSKAIGNIVWAFQNWQFVLGYIIGFIIGNMVESFTKGLTLLGGLVGMAITGIANRWKALPGEIAMIWGWITQTFLDNVGKLHNAISSGVNWIGDRFKELPGKIVEVWQSLPRLFNENVGKLHNAVGSGINWIADRFRELPGKIGEALSGMWSAGKDAMNKFWDGVKSVAGNIGAGLVQGFQAGRKAGGTHHAKGGMYQINETGREMVILPNGSQVIRASDTRDLISGQTVNITINNPSVRNDNDIQMIVQQVTEALNNNQRLKRLGV